MVLAVTGKCCSGKDYVSNMFREVGFDEIDVDSISKNVFNQNIKEIEKLLGTTDRGEIAKIIFSDSRKRVALEELIHPLVYDIIFEDIEKYDDVIVNIPLITDNQLIERIDALLWVKSPLPIRIIRALKRDSHSFFTILKRIFVQRKLSVKHLKSKVDIYTIGNGLFSSRLKEDFEYIMTILRRG